MWLDNASKIDFLFYKPYAEIVGNIVKRKKGEPLTIGVFGLWGAGKSTLLNLIEDELKSEEKLLCVNINAWMFESYDDAKSAIMEALLQELNGEFKQESSKNKLKLLMKRIDWFKLGTNAIGRAAPIAASVALGNPIPMMLSIGDNPEKIGETVKSAAGSLQKLKDEYWKSDDATEDPISHIRQFKSEFEEAIEDEGINNVVVLIDDLDRCRPERIIEILEAIKLFLSVKKTTFVIAADENVIQYAIRGKYPPIEGIDIDLAKEYIEKIIQLPIYIPELSSKDIQNYLIMLVAQEYLSEDNFNLLVNKIIEDKLIISEDIITVETIIGIITGLKLSWVEDETEFRKIAVVIERIRGIISVTLMGNPRQAKRFLNTFVTKQKLAKIYYGDEIDLSLLAKILVLQKLEPSLFVRLNEWNKSFDGENQNFIEMQKAVASGDTKEHEQWASTKMRNWLDCEPVDLGHIPLDKYFYLTRESLTQVGIDEALFSKKVKDVLLRIVSVTSGLMPTIIQDVKSLSLEEQDDVFNVLIQKIKEDKVKNFAFRDFYIEFKAHRVKIIEAIVASTRKFKVGDIPVFRRMYQEDTELMYPYLEKMNKEGLLTKEQMTDIVEEKGQ